MTAANENKSRVRFQPFEDLESPFLEQGLFTERGEEEWEGRLGALEAESPFLRGFEAAINEPEFSDESALAEEELGIIGQDDERARVRNTLAVPFRWICSIAVQRRIKTATKERLTGLADAGTGVLISPYHVLTAAHVLRSVERDAQGGITERHEAQFVAVKPGRDANNTPFGTIEAKSWRLHPNWNPESNTWAFDYAVITLKEAVGNQTFKGLKGQRLCFWDSSQCGANTSLDNLPAAVARRLVGAQVFTAGYPATAKGQMLCSLGIITSGQAQQDAVLVRNNRVEEWARRISNFFINADATEGQSGSPVWVVDNGTRYLIGVLIDAGKNFNHVINLNSDVMRQIQNWIGNAAAGAKPQNLLDESELWRGEEFEPAEETTTPKLVRQAEQGWVDVLNEEMTEWDANWALDEGQGPLPTDFNQPWVPMDAEEMAEEVALEYDMPPMTQAISDAVDQKDWSRVLELAIQVGWHDENQLTNLLFFSRHPERNRRKLEPKKNKEDQKPAQEWSQTLIKEVRPAIQKAAEDSNLKVSGDLVAERDPLLSGEQGAKFKEVVAWAAKEVDIDPGFLAAVLLAEVGSASPYLSSGEVRSFFTGTDDFFAQRVQLRANVPAFAQVHFDKRKTTTSINEHGRQVTTISFKTGRDATLATAVYLKYGELKLRRAAQKNGGDFDALPVATRFGLVRIAMAAGHGGISPEGDLIRFKKKGGRLVWVRPGETGGILLGVARSLDRVLKGEDILVRNWEPRKDPTNDSHITHRNATILASQAMHLGDWFFRAEPLGLQPNPETLEEFDQEIAEFYDEGSYQTRPKGQDYSQFDDEDLSVDNFVGASGYDDYATQISTPQVEQYQPAGKRPLQERPMNPISDTYVPPGGKLIPVQTGQSWISIAKSLGIDAWDLIDFNFPGMKQLQQIDPQRASRQVNWYLTTYVGCEIATADKENWTFTSGLTKGQGAWKGGHIFVPSPKLPPSAPEPTCSPLQIPPLLNALPLALQQLLYFLDISLPSQVRCLTKAERELAQPVYEKSLDYDHIYVSDKSGIDDRAFTIAIPVSPAKWVVILNVGSDASEGNKEKKNIREEYKRTLIHELVHAWQSQHHPQPWMFMYNCVRSQMAASAATALYKLGSSSWGQVAGTLASNPILTARASVLGPAEAYAYVPGKPFGEYAGEQIAQQVEDCFCGLANLGKDVKKHLEMISEHIKMTPAGAHDKDNIQSLSKIRFAYKNDPQVVWP